MKKNPIYAAPLRNPDAEADAQRLADVLKREGEAAAEQALRDIAKAKKAVLWEVLVLADRAKFIARSAA